MSFGEVVLTVRGLCLFFPTTLLSSMTTWRENFKKLSVFVAFFSHCLPERLGAGQFMHRKSQTKRSARLAVTLAKKETGLQFNAANKLQQKNENQNDNSAPKKFD